MSSGIRRGLQVAAGAASALLLGVTLLLLFADMLPPRPLHLEAWGTRIGPVCGDAYGGCVVRVGGMGALTALLAASAGGLGLWGALRLRRAALGAAGVMAAALWIPTALGETMVLHRNPSGWEWSGAYETAFMAAAAALGLVLASAAWGASSQPRRPPLESEIGRENA